MESNSNIKNKLSHSQCSKYQDCPQAWYYHYKEKLRHKYHSAALLFGSALDHALTSILKDKDKNPNDIFAFFWRFQQLNDQDVYLTNCIDIVYANSDFDFELLQDVDLQNIKEKYKIEDIGTTIKQLYEEKDLKGFNGLSKDKKELLNVFNWYSLYRKGLLMIKQFQKDILPNIEKVLAVQVYVTLKNEDDDVIIGYADLVCKYKNHGTVILDFKTASKEYDEENSVLTSPQLTLYVHSLEEEFKTRKAGYIVFNKHVRKNKTKACSRCNKDGTGQGHRTCDNTIEGKRCHGAWIVKINPEVTIQTIINEIPTQTEDIVLQNYDYINQSIKNGIVYRNFQSCIKPWGHCPFFKKCYNNSDEDLIKC